MHITFGQMWHVRSLCHCNTFCKAHIWITSD